MVVPPSESGDVRSFDPVEWIETPLPFLDEIEADADLAVGDWNVLFYAPDCGACEVAITELQSHAARTALISVALQSTRSDLPVTGKSDWSHGRMRDNSGWFLSTPLLLRLKDGRVSLSDFRVPA